MEELTLYHNPRCSKSRGALELLRARGAPHRVVEYLAAPPGRGEIERILGLLPGLPGELVRRDARFRELDLDPTGLESPAAVAALLAEHPELLQRPLAVRGDAAVIGRPPEKILELL